MIKKFTFFIFLFGSLLLNAQETPNIIFIEVDDLPSHYTTLKGLSTADTPTIDKLADQGVYFNNAICQGTMCGPSRNSFIIGQYPHNIGFYENGSFCDIPAGTWTLPSALQRAGYFTAHVGKSHLHPSKSGLSGTKVEKNRQAHERLGFDYVWNSLGRSVASKGKDYGVDMYVDFLMDYDAENGTKYYDQLLSKESRSTLPDDIYLDGLYTKLALEFMEDHKNDKYFLWVNYSVPHGPYDVKESYHKFTLSDVPEPNFITDTGVNIPNLLRPHPYKESNQEDNQLGNMANISYMDFQVSRLLDKIEETGNKDRTVVVFFSDHGILVGDHGLEHKSTLYKEVLDPTLIIYDPRNSNKGLSISKPVELMDLLKTTMDWAECSSNDKNMPRGETLTPLLNNTNGYSKTFAVGESPGYYAIVTENYKYIAPFYFQEDGFEVLFDLKNDPNERVNVADDKPEVISEFRDISDKWLSESGEVVLQGDCYTLSDDEAFGLIKKYNIFPNPIEDLVTISGDFNNSNSLMIYSLDGKLVLRKIFAKPQRRHFDVGVSNLKAGSYLLDINGVRYKIIKE